MNDIKISDLNLSEKDLRRIGSKNCYVAKGKYLISYTTVIGVKDGWWKYTDRKYSVTTTRQRNSFMRQHSGEIIPHEEFIKLVTGE